MATKEKAPVEEARTGKAPPNAYKRFRYRLENAGLGAATALVPALPRGIAMRLAAMVGWLLYYLLPEDRNVAFANLDIVFGDTKTHQEKRRIVRSTFHLLASNLVGLLWAPRLTRATIDRYVDFDTEAQQTIRGHHDSGKGLIVICPHYGDWEIMSLAVGFAGIPYTTIMEPTKNPAVQELVARLRSVSGHTVVHPRFAVLKLFKALGRGGTVGVLVDVNARRGRGGVWLDFFGLKVFNSSAVAELAIRTGAAIVFGHAEPLPDGRAKVVISTEIPVERTGDHDRDVLTTSQRCLDECAKLIREKPDHWLWTYKRWKRRPSPEKGNFPFYSKYDANT